jgi:hypothetical protein
MRVGLSFAEDTNMPTTNNSEVVHSVWWRVVGNDKTKVTIVTTTEFESARAVIQSSQYRQYLSDSRASTGPNLDVLVHRSKYRLAEAKRFSKQIHESIMGTDLHARGTGPEGVTHTKKVKRSVRSNAHKDDSWRPDYDLREVPELVRNGPARTQSTGPTHKAQEDAAYTRRDQTLRLPSTCRTKRSFISRAPTAPTNHRRKVLPRMHRL